MKRTRLRPVSKKTRTVRWPRLAALRKQIIERSGGRCEVCTDWGPVDIHHVIKRSHGGRDEWTNLIALCRWCHDKTDAPYSKGRLVITRPPNKAIPWLPGESGFLWRIENVKP